MLSTTSAATERRPAVWPWLVMPLVVLAVFFTLHSVHGTPHNGPGVPDGHGPGAADGTSTAEP